MKAHETKPYKIETWTTFKKNHYFASFGRKTSPAVILTERGYRYVAGDEYDDKTNWKKEVENYVNALMKGCPQYKYVDCVYNVYRTNQSDIFLDIYIKTYG